MSRGEGGVRLFVAGYMGDGVILTVYSILAGLVFLAVGLFLFEKYAEI